MFDVESTSVAQGALWTHRMCYFSKRTLGYLEVSLGQKEKSVRPSVRPVHDTTKT